MGVRNEKEEKKCVMNHVFDIDFFFVDKKAKWLATESLYGLFTAHWASKWFRQRSHTRTGLFELARGSFVLAQVSQKICPQLKWKHSVMNSLASFERHSYLRQWCLRLNGLNSFLHRQHSFTSSSFIHVELRRPSFSRNSSSRLMDTSNFNANSWIVSSWSANCFFNSCCWRVISLLYEWYS